MVERTFDEALNIHTIGVREWRGKEEEQYNRYEATPYEALEMFFNQYELKQTDTLVDFGAGEGRVSFYVHNRFNIPVKGIENNDKTFEEVQEKEAKRLFYGNQVEPAIDIAIYNSEKDYADCPKWEELLYFLLLDSRLEYDY